MIVIAMSKYKLDIYIKIYLMICYNREPQNISKSYYQYIKHIFKMLSFQIKLLSGIYAMYFLQEIFSTPSIRD